MLGPTLILRGLPGSGKSTITAGIDNPLICSADEFMTGPDGKYEWKAEKLGWAHRSCFEKFEAALTSERAIVVDNTNCTVNEMRPYYDASVKAGRETKIVTVTVPTYVSLKRNVHGVPPKTIDLMALDMLRAELPPEWKHETRKGA